MKPLRAGRGLSERRLVFLIGAVQFIIMFDVMMVVPLGPDLARALDFPNSQLGLVSGSFTAAAAATGVAGAFFLERFARRRAFAVSLAGLLVGTLAGGLSSGLGTLLAARFVAGAFGGPASALAFAIISDGVPPERRGRAMGAVMGAFGVAATFGVPGGLELARLGGWRAPFFAIGALGAIVASVAIAMLPPQTAHLAAAGRTAPAPFGNLLTRPVVLLSLASTAVGVVATFALVPNLSAYFQFNLGYPRDRLGLLFLAGGVVSFGTMRLAGWLTDRRGPTWVTCGSSIVFIVVLAVGFIHPMAWLPVLAVFVGFTVADTSRTVPMQALSSRVPDLSEHARFMSAQSAVQQLAMAAGAVLSAQILTERADHQLVGIAALAWFAVAASIGLPALVHAVDRRVRTHEAAVKERTGCTLSS